MRRVALILALLAMGSTHLSAQVPRLGTRVPQVSSPPGATPTITSFTPTSGPVLTTVTVTGIQFTGATAVTVNGTSASFTLVSDTVITLTVPTSATTGAIAVTTSNGTGTSSTNFTVTPTYYVATTGSDAVSCATAKTITTPKLTLSNAVACLSAGDTLYIRGGTYTGASNVIDSSTTTVPSGTSWTNAVTIAGYPGETVTIQPPDGGGAIGLSTGAPHYLIFQDVVLDGSLNFSRFAGDIVYLSSGAHHNRFLRLEVKNAYLDGYQFSDNVANSPFNEIVGGSIHDNGRSTGTGDGYGYALYCLASDTLVDGVDVYANQGYGLIAYGSSNATRATFRNNTIHGNGTNPNGSRGSTLFGILLATGTDNVAYNNVIYGNAGGIQLYNASQSAFNNTIYDNNLNGGNANAGIRVEAGATSILVKNNIVYSNTIANIDDRGTGTTLTTNFTTNPTFVNAGTFDFHLQASSGAVDAGTTLTLFNTDKDKVIRPVGPNWDIGAYER